MSRYLAIKAVLDADPATFGGLDDAAAAAELMAEDKSYDLPSMTGKQVKDLIVQAEWEGLTDVKQQTILALTARDDLDPHGIDAVIFLHAMPAGPNPLTSAALNAARTITTSTAFIKGLGEVTAIHVQYARAIG
jgi:hypothetical protein